MELVKRFKGFLLIYLIVVIATFGMIARVNVLEGMEKIDNNLIVIN